MLIVPPSVGGERSRCYTAATGVILPHPSHGTRLWRQSQRPPRSGCFSETLPTVRLTAARRHDPSRREQAPTVGSRLAGAAPRARRCQCSTQNDTASSCTASRSFVCPGSTLERGAPTLFVFLGDESGDHQPAQYASRLALAAAPCSYVGSHRSATWRCESLARRAPASTPPLVPEGRVHLPSSPHPHPHDDRTRSSDRVGTHASI